MKYIIEGFNQEKAIELGLDGDDLIILRWFTDFSSNMKKKEIEGTVYYWVTYDKLLEDIPILNVKKRALKYRLDKFINAKILIHKNFKEGGNFSYYGFGENYLSLIADTEKTLLPLEGNRQDNEKISMQELADDFDKIWQIYPRKDGKNVAFNHYKSWLKGRDYAGRKVKLDNKQMWYATKKYADLVKGNKTEKQYIKMGSTFFNDEIMEYVEVKIDE